MPNHWRYVSSEAAHDEALRRIGNVRSEGLPELDLGDLPLTELPDELSDLVSLQSLRLDALHDAYDDVEDNRPGFQGRSISQLKGLISLTSLDLSGCAQLSDLSPLGQLFTLKSINLSMCEQVFDLSPLSNLTVLTSLNLSWCRKLTDLNPLAT